MLAPGTVDKLIAVRRRSAASEEAQSAVFCPVWVVIRLHVDLLRLTSALCHA
ncbi:MAG: hypothetical protein ACRDRU_11195 [Pseudonocardiaceae bacterium]